MVSSNKVKVWSTITEALSSPITDAKQQYLEHYIYPLPVWNEDEYFAKLKKIGDEKIVELVCVCGQGWGLVGQNCED